MSALMGETELRRELMSKDEEFKRLAVQHQRYEDELDRLQKRHHLSENDRIQEITLKKKKLILKDQMYTIVRRYRKELEARS